MHLFCSNEFDVESIELLYVYIIEYKVFNNIGFKFTVNNLFSVNEEKLFDKDGYFCISHEIQNNIDLFEEYNLNLNVICGKNGSGKTTLINILEQDLSVDLGDSNRIPKVIFLYKDKNNNFASTYKSKISSDNKKIVLSKINKGYERSEISFMKLDGVEGLETRRKMVDTYICTPFIFNDILTNSNGEKIPYFKFFKVSIYEGVKKAENVKYGKYSLEGLVDYLDLINIFDKDLFWVFVLSEFENPDYYDFLNKKIGFSEGFFERLKLYFESFNSIKMRKIRNLQIRLLSKKFICQYKDYNCAQKIVLKFAKLCISFLDEVTNVSTGESFDYRYSRFSLCFFYEGYNEIDGNEISFFNYSSGEISQFFLRSKLGRALSNKGSYLIQIDEAQNSLHPEWCRTFIKDFIDAFQVVTEFAKREKGIQHTKMTVVIATHSPFFISDLTNENIIYLDKTKYNGVFYPNESSFAGNIGELFYSNFFMTQTIGEFAKNKINKIIDAISSGIDFSSEEYEYYKRFFSLVGDELLRKVLLNQLEDKKNEENKSCK